MIITNNEKQIVFERALQSYMSLKQDADSEQIDKMFASFGFVADFLEQFSDPRLCQIMLKAGRLSWEERENLIKHLDKILAAE
jgi:6-phosphogluconate dehydrogenase